MYRHTLDNMLEGCQIIGFDWRYIYINDAAEKHNRRPKEELLGKKYMEMWPGIEDTEVFMSIKNCMEDRIARSMENEFEFPEGKRGWFLLSIEPVPDGVLILSLDITERKHAELRIQHLNRLYATLSQVNQTIVHVKEQDKLFETICKVAVNSGKFGLAWIGQLDRETGQVTPVVCYGAGQNHFPFQTIDINQAPFRNGLIGKAMNTGQTVHSRDIQSAPAMRHWSETAFMGGFHSAAVVPFHLNGEICGFLNLFAADLDFFENEEQHKLLVEMGMDISFALDNSGFHCIL